jgi:hypothetical protein
MKHAPRIVLLLVTGVTISVAAQESKSAELPAIRIQRMGGETPWRFRLQDHVEREGVASGR